MYNIIILNLDGDVIPFLESGHGYTRITDSLYRKLIPGFDEMTAQAQERHIRKWFKSDATIVCEAESILQLPNTHKKLNGHLPTLEDFRRGAAQFLKIADLFCSKEANYLLLSVILCGQRAAALRRAEPSFHAALSVNGTSQPLEECLRALVACAVTRDRWNQSGCQIRRTSILDYTHAVNALSPHIIDYSRVKVTGKGIHGARIPFPYTDTVVLVKGATATQLREATPCLENAAVIFLNGASGDFLPTRLHPSSVAAYDPDVLTQIRQAQAYIAALLRFWWSSAENEDIWAREIVSQARLSFGKPDGHYVRCELDPKPLGNAIRYRVFLSFLNALEAHGIMVPEDLGLYRQEAKDVFEPVPASKNAPLQADQPKVFLDLMRKIVSQYAASIVDEGSHFVKSQKHLAAWRMISKRRYLVFPEDQWGRVYKKVARDVGNIDLSYFQRDGWERALQKTLCQSQLIKEPSSGYRFRYDLYGNGTRDTTYVIAVPSDLLEI